VVMVVLRFGVRVGVTVEVRLPLRLGTQDWGYVKGSIGVMVEVELS